MTRRQSRSHWAILLPILLAGACQADSTAQVPEKTDTASDGESLVYANVRAVFAEEYALGQNGKFRSPVIEEKFEQFRSVPTFRGCMYGTPGYNLPFGVEPPPEIVPEDETAESQPWTEETGEDDGVQPDTIEDTAIIDVQLSSYLNRLGIPEAIYRPSLDKWVKASLSGAPDAYRIVDIRFDYKQKGVPLYETTMAKLDADLVTDINANIDKAGLGRKIRLEPDEGCGAGDVPYRIQTVPANSTVGVIQTTYFKLCRARKIDPYDRTKCNGWKELRDGQLALMAGDYQWAIDAAGRPAKTGKLSLYGSQEADEIPLKIGE